MQKGASLPDRCIKCNGPIEGRRIAKNLYWHPPWVYLLILVNLLVYVIVALLIRKKAPIVVPICDRHQRHRLIAILCSWLMAIGGLVLIPVGAFQGDGVLAFAGFLICLFGIVLGGVKAIMVAARKITEQHISVRGCCQEYLAWLPEWPGKL